VTATDAPGSDRTPSVAVAQSPLPTLTTSTPWVAKRMRTCGHCVDTTTASSHPQRVARPFTSGPRPPVENTRVKTNANMRVRVCTFLSPAASRDVRTDARISFVYTHVISHTQRATDAHNRFQSATAANSNSKKEPPMPAAPWGIRYRTTYMGSGQMPIKM
jgi:hypothetical protein